MARRSQRRAEGSSTAPSLGAEIAGSDRRAPVGSQPPDAASTAALAPPCPEPPNVWTSVTFTHHTPRSTDRLDTLPTAVLGRAATTDTPDAPEAQQTRTRRRRRVPLVAGLTVASLALSGGAVAYTSAHKHVTLDVDGRIIHTTTFASSVGGLLEAEGVTVGARDLVSPAADQELAEGADVVVRYGRELTLQADGKETTTWVTALDADEALAALSARGSSDVSLVASRSGERAALGLRLDAQGPVAVVADGKSVIVKHNDTVDGALADAGITLGDADLVTVLDLGAAGLAETDLAAAQAAGAGVVVRVQRVATQQVTTTTAVPFETEQRDDASLYVGDSKVLQEGADGVRTVVENVQTVDGVETGRTVVSDEVTTAPVSKVVLNGTQERPKDPRAIGQMLAAARGWTGSQWTCLDKLFTKESNWRVTADNPTSSAYGIPQALPGSKMASVGSDWRTNPATQITWGLNYIAGRYGTPCGAWSHSQSHNWY